MTKPTNPRQHFEDQLAELVDKFNRQRDRYLSPDYNETDVRVEFIDRFFDALGWDVYNRAGLGKYERDVAREVTEVSGRFDYQFQMHGRAMFIVEAKAPHVPLERTDVIMQAKKYAWNSKESSIVAVTDFEEFRLYDATLRPDPKHPEVGLIFAHKYATYLKPKVLDDLWLLSKEAVAAGSIEQLLSRSSVKQRDRIPVDRAFLDDLTEWREKLAKAVYKIEPEIELADLNSVVQVFLDRLIFIRFGEDCGILPKYELEYIARRWANGSKPSIGNELNALFHEVNWTLNGEIFKFHRCEKVDWEQEAALVAKIIMSLYSGPYRFDVIGVELLGSIYERYLGKTIRVTATRAVVEDKPEVRKAGGVYYTPKYIVDYIVDQTVGKLIEGKSPDHIAKLKILDPACGSGSFLLGAYQKLLDYHVQWKASHQRKRGHAAPGQARLMLDDSAEYEVKLSLEEKAAILRNNIYGVDLDQQAVEITMMSLYIKMLEGERGAIMGRGILPPLRDNIKCGNSLIGHDISEPGLFGETLSSEELDRIKPFDWDSQREGFGDMMAAGGFDAVIGNPPYGAYLYDDDKTYLNTKFKHQTYQLDSYLLFLEKSLKTLLRRNGYYGMIIPNPWLTNILQTSIRRFVIEKTRVLEIVHFLFPVFPRVTVDTEVVLLQNADPKNWQALVTIVESSDDIVTGLIRDRVTQIRHNQERWRALQGGVINIFMSEEENSLAQKCASLSRPMSSFCATNVGIKPYQVGKGRPLQKRDTVENRVFDSNRKTGADYRLYLRGSDIGRYKIEPLETRYLKYGPWLAEPRPAANFDALEKIVMRQTGDSLVAVIDTAQYLCLNNMHVLVPIDSRPALSYILGVLNSRLLNWYYHMLNPEVGEALAEVKKTNVAQLPIRPINFDDPSDKAKHDRMVALVDRMLDLHRQKQAATSDATRARLERDINVTDEKIDALVYQLYGLTADEIKIVEGQ